MFPGLWLSPSSNLWSLQACKNVDGISELDDSESGVLGTRLGAFLFDKKEVRPIKTKLHMHMVAT